MSNTALAGVKVLEFATMVSGPYCGKLLGDMGAEVVKVELPVGDPSRAAGPFPEGGSDPEKSALYLYNNTSKRSLVLDPGEPDQQEPFEDLIAWCDVLIDNHSPRILEAAGLDWQALQVINPRLIYTVITPYGLSGPREHVPGDELTLIHAGGLGNLLPVRVTNTDRAPIKMGGYPVGYHAGISAALSSCAAIVAQRSSGRGCLIDISMQEVILAMMAPSVTSAHYHGTTWSRLPDRPPAMGRMQTSDGYVILNALDDHHFRALADLMGNPDWCAGKEWDSMAYRSHHLMEIAPMIDAWMLKQAKDDLHHRAAGKGIPIGPIRTAAEVMNSAQYKARDYFREVDHPKAGKLRYAGTPYRMSRTPSCNSRPAPLMNQHRDEILDLLKSVAGNPKAVPSSADTSLPLAGIRVLEFCWVWAGPYAGMLLASLGAEVIKVEGHTRTDLMRRSVVWPLAEAEPTSVPPNQGLAFNTVNLNKKGVTLDLSKPEGVRLALDLAKDCDVVVDNMRPGAMAKLGLSYDDFLGVRPNIIGASSSGRGCEGPESEYLGFASIHHGIGGGAYITGYADDHPSHSTGDVDIMNATTLAYAIVAAIFHRVETGEGQFIDYSQCEGVSALIGEQLLGYEMTAEIPTRHGNAHPDYAPHNVYRAWGADRWLALEIHSDEEFSILAQVIGQPDLANDPRFTGAAARKENESELDTIIESWTRQRDRDWIVNSLNDAGLAAAPSREARDLFADAHLRQRGAFIKCDHPQLGELELIRVPWIMSDQPMPQLHAPLLGEHNEYVLGDLLKLDSTEIAELKQKGIIM
ncbi:MAG TPA: CoA transferase [Pseudomonadales bacterium]|jgi:crotonobetainyl-CoA:carnitine CoA-transferase CaiB-like acyl-CoA transferase|nr:CoA transferase [Pseudomonadales bacterium]